MTILDLLAGEPSQLLHTVFLPFLVIFAIFWGVLSVMKIFGRKINIVLSLALTIIIASTDAFALISTYLAQYTAYTAIAAFTIVFIFGTVMWALRSGREIYYKQVPTRELQNIRKKIAKLRDKYHKAPDREKPAILKQIMTLEEKERQLIYEVQRR